MSFSFFLLLGLPVVTLAGKFDFHMFENFLATEKVFKNELQLVTELEKLKKTLEVAREFLQHRKSENIKTLWKSELPSFEKKVDNLSTPFGSIEDYHGACKVIR